MTKVRPIPCEVCRKRPATAIVAAFISACEECAAKIETAIRHARNSPSNDAPLSSGDSRTHRRSRGLKDSITIEISGHFNGEETA